MARREDTLIAQIEQEALDDDASLSAALRKCVILGGKSGSEQLRDWATRELQGYIGVDVPLPDYREIPAQIQIDGATMQGLVTSQPIARSALPDFVQEKVDERVELRDGAGAIEALVQKSESSGDAVKLSLPMGGDIARLMSADLDGQQILSVYWAVAPAALRGVLDQIRTALTLLIAELRANMPTDEQVPSAATADHAIQFVITGERHNINVTAAHAEGDATSASVALPESLEVDSQFWTKSRKIGAFIVGVATIVAAVAAVIAVA